MTINHAEKTAIARLAAVATITDLRGQGAPTIHSVSISQHTQGFGYVQYGRIARRRKAKDALSLFERSIAPSGSSPSGGGWVGVADAALLCDSPHNKRLPPPNLPRRGRHRNGAVRRYAS